MKKICIVAFSDIESNSLAYKKFDDIDKAVKFYKKQLERDDVNVISTRKTIVQDKQTEEILCKHCNMPISIRNPSGFCDHLYYPDYCKVCQEKYAI